MVAAGPVSSPAEFAAAVAAHPFDLDLDAGELAAAARVVADDGLLVVGETHGVRETATALYALAVASGARALAFEWSHEEMDDLLQSFLGSGTFDFERLWALPATAELFCGDGRITAGHFALLGRLRAEGRLQQAIAFDRLDPEPLPDDWRVRERDLAARLLEQWDRRLPLLVLTGAFHARPDAPQGDTMTALLRRELPRVFSLMLDYAGMSPLPAAPLRLRVPVASPAVVPGKR